MKEAIRMLSSEMKTLVPSLKDRNFSSMNNECLPLKK